MQLDTLNVDNVELPFDFKWPNIAISVSGGADSALLAHLLCLYAYDNTTIDRKSTRLNSSH